MDEKEPVEDPAPAARSLRGAAYLQALRQRRWARIVGVSLFGAVGAGLLVGRWLLPNCKHEGCPEVDQIESYRPPEPPQILDTNGRLAGQLAGPRRIVVSFDSIPKLVREGYIAVEDKRFRDHHGVDLSGGIRAFVRDLGSGGADEGASTITMQLARNVFGPEVRNYNKWHRKAVEIRTAREIEDRLTKDKILELYLNQIYLGDGVYGVETAARHYFGKSVLDVTPAEAAVLIGLAKNPEGYNPNRNPDRAKERRDLVLDMLADAKLLSPAEAASAKRQGVETVDDDEGPTSWGTNAYYVNAVWRELRDLYPNPSERAGLRVFTGLDQEAQKAANDALVSEIHAVEHGAAGHFGGKPAPAQLGRAKGDSPYLQGMVVAMDVQTGLVSTLIGGRDFDHSEFDRAFQAKRQPGSSFKPIVYVTALASGLRPIEMIPTDPIRLAQQGSPDWEPGDHISAPMLTVRDALVYSSNTASIRIGERAGIPRVIEQAHAMGISTDLPNYPSIFLGSGDVIPAELVAAYATFGNGGHTIKPHLIEHIEDADGHVVYQKQPDGGQNAVDPRLGFLVLDMMRDVVRRGTGTRAMIQGMPMAGKTGTTNDSKDLWFVGLTPKRVAGVWVGFDQPQTVVHNIAGGDVAAPVWARFMTVASRNDRGMGDWQPPSGVVQVAVDLQTGMRWNASCGGQQRTEWFLSGTEPAGECVAYGPGWIQNAAGQWEYQGQPDSLGTGSTYGYGAHPDTGRTIFWRDSTAEIERRRQQQLDSLDRIWNAGRAQPTRTDSDRPMPTQTTPGQPPQPSPPSPKAPLTSGDAGASVPTAPSVPRPQTPGQDTARSTPKPDAAKPAAPDTAGVR